MRVNTASFRALTPPPIYLLPPGEEKSDFLRSHQASRSYILTVDSDTKQTIKDSIISLLDYCQKNDWAGFDPFDGLNSRVFTALPFLQNKLCKLIFIQSMKRAPINLRHIFLVPKGQNPKGIALFCSALLKLSNLRLLHNDEPVPQLLRRLIELRSPKRPYYCWGYNFDWQNRAFLLPKFEPNIICTTFAGNALIDAYEKYTNTAYLNMAISAGQFLLHGLNITSNKDELCFSYTPFDRGQVHNANLLGAAFLSRLYSITGKTEFLDPALRAVQFSVARQNEDGSWPYGESKTQRWVDNFHTGYNLLALKKFSQYTGDKSFTDTIRKGYQFYRNNFFTAAGLPKYYHNRLYPIDIHSIAYSIITLTELNTFDESAKDLAMLICKWGLENMQSEKGYFYYQQKRCFKNRISYMRWSQAWMLYGLAIFAENIYAPNKTNICHPDNTNSVV